MKFQTLQENLRKVIWSRIEAGQLTGLKLAHQTGFQQAHISNFLNRKRGLSLEGMDKVLSVQKLSVLDLLDPAEINKRASIPPPPEEGFQNVLLTDSVRAAKDVLITAENVRDILKFKRGFLKKLRSEMETDRSGWTRFVLIRMASDAMTMYPRLLPGATVLIDRHYNSLKPYRKGEQNMYAVRKDGDTTVKYVELSGNTLILRPHNQAYPVDIITIDKDSSYGDYIIGRICYVGMET
ncbi:MAG: helix-turn-helix transcriptional regulator [Terriglobales bacterium]